MPTLQFETLDPIKIPLIKRFYKQHYPGAKPKSDELTIVAYKESSMVALVRFREIGKYRLLTGMVVAEQCRNLRIGKELLAYCAQHILGPHDYCFAYGHLEHFYQQGYFVTIDENALPSDLKGLYQRYTQHGKNLIPMHFMQDEM
ncbi:GNAT family N-acetyltransferase [Vibrio tritonius]|uniref:GNAT family N-acetyltransferase n=1 Tax=Vibrio tritonius TaxID=1435069 RepID=UPI00315D6093